MPTDLPTLKTGCGMIWRTDEFISTAGRYRLSPMCTRSNLCPTCQHNLDAVKKNAAAHQKEADKLSRKLKRFSTNNNLQRQNQLRDYIIRKFHARDAVLDLLPEELKEKAEEKKNEQT